MDDLEQEIQTCKNERPVSDQVQIPIAACQKRLDRFEKDASEVIAVLTNALGKEGKGEDVRQCPSGLTTFLENLGE